MVLILLLYLLFFAIYLVFFLIIKIRDFECNFIVARYILISRTTLYYQRPFTGSSIQYHEYLLNKLIDAPMFRGDLSSKADNPRCPLFANVTERMCPSNENSRYVLIV